MSETISKITRYAELVVLVAERRYTASEFKEWVALKNELEDTVSDISDIRTLFAVNFDIDSIKDTQRVCKAIQAILK